MTDGRTTTASVKPKPKPKGKSGPKGSILEVRANKWEITGYKEDIQRLQDKENWPCFVADVYGGLETCPTTGRLHHQGALKTNTTQRLAAIKKWLPYSHIEVAKDWKALIAYSMKSDTAAGPKVHLTSDFSYKRSDQVMMVLAQEAVLLAPGESVLEFVTINPVNGEQRRDSGYDMLMRSVVRKDLTFVNFHTPALRSMWIKFHDIFIRKAKERPPDPIESDEPPEAERYSITRSATPPQSVEEDIPELTEDESGDEADIELAQAIQVAVTRQPQT